ncbi:MAG: kinesin light chain-like [Gemmatimonadetes bacterium]|nr:kinesin light chain-like [Gemmatimonadota bacterium]
MPNPSDDLDHALADVHRVLTEQEAEHGPHALRLIPVLQSLCAVQQRRGDWRGLLETARRMHAIVETAAGPLHPATVTHLNNVGSVLNGMGRADEALGWFERAAADGEQALGPTHPMLATILNNAALIRHARGEPTEARALLERALSIDTAAYGPHHTSVGRDHHRLGVVLRALGDEDGARTHFAAAVAAFTATVGAEHEYTARVRELLEAAPS